MGAIGSRKLWGSSHHGMCWDDWSAAVVATGSQKGQVRKEGLWVALCTGQGFGCTELRDSGHKAESPWVTGTGMANKAEILLGACPRPPGRMKGNILSVGVS